MTFFILYLAVQHQFSLRHEHHFAFKETCEKVGKDLVRKYRYEGYKCVEGK